MSINQINEVFIKAYTLGRHSHHRKTEGISHSSVPIPAVPSLQRLCFTPGLHQKVDPCVLNHVERQEVCSGHHGILVEPNG